jgi:NAD(P)H-dependent FMN reductase
MTSRPLVHIIAGSVRAQRLCPRIAAWVAKVGAARVPLALEVVELSDWPLPMDDEAGIPALGVYGSERTRAWSEKIAQADGFVFVTPQYNWGYPAALKNALDHLHREWRGKPAAIVSYGGHGGGKCAAQLNQVAQGLKMRVAPTMPGLELSDEAIRDAALDPARDFTAHVAAVEQAFDELAALLADQPAPAAAPV